MHRLLSLHLPASCNSGTQPFSQKTATSDRRLYAIRLCPAYDAEFSLSPRTTRPYSGREYPPNLRSHSSRLVESSSISSRSFVPPDSRRERKKLVREAMASPVKISFNSAEGRAHYGTWGPSGRQKCSALQMSKTFRPTAREDSPGIQRKRDCGDGTPDEESYFGD